MDFVCLNSTISEFAELFFFFPQYDISKDIVALNSIRELLVVMRMWGLVRSQCLPVFSRSAENLDVLATLYKLLTRLTLNPSEPDEVLLGESN